MIVKPKKLGIFLVALLLLLSLVAVFFRAPSAMEISGALDTTIIEQFSLKKATKEEALSVLMNHFYQQHPELRHVRLEYYPSAERVTADSARTLIYGAGIPAIPDTEAESDDLNTVNLRNIPVIEALRYVTSLSNCGFAVRNGKIYIYAPTNPPPITMRERFAECLDWLSSRMPK